MTAAFETALDYAAHRLPVFPCHSITVDGHCTCGNPECESPGKHPRTTHGHRDATTDERQLLHWHERWPDANWAVACGDRISVIDIDPKYGADPREIADTYGLGGPMAMTGEAPEADEKYPDSLSGVRGAHAYCLNGVPTGDTSIPGVEIKADGGYVLIPGSRHITGIAYEWADDTRLPWTVPLAAVPRALHPKTPVPAQADDDGPVRKGKRDKTLFRLGCSMRSAGFSGGAILAALRVFNRERCQPPLKDKQVGKLARSASRYEPRRAPSTKSKLIVLDTHRMLTTDPPPIEWLADGIFARGKFTLFGGREKGGKSLVQLALGVAMAGCGAAGDIGEPHPPHRTAEIAGIPVQAGKVLLIDAENGENEIHRRLRSLGLDPAYSNNLVVVEARGIDLRTDLKSIAALIEEHAPDLVLLDSFRSLWRGSEKDEDEVANALYPVASLAHERNVAISLTHHATKRDGSDYRGSTAIGAAVDWIVMLAREESDPLKATRRVLTTPYVRFAAERPSRWLSILSDGDEGPVSLVEADAYESEHGTPVVDELEAKLTEWVRGVVVRSPIGEHHTAPSAWTKAELCRALKRGEKDWAAHQAISRLIDHRHLYANGRRWSPADTLFDENQEQR